MGKFWRKRCDGTQCKDPTFFSPARAPAAVDPFFKSPAADAAHAAHSTDVPGLQKEDVPQPAEKEKKDPLVEGLKTTAEKLAEHEPLKKWADPKLHQLKLSLWDKLSPADKAAMLTFMGLNVGIGGAAFAASPQLRRTLSDVNIGKPLGWIPYSPIEGFKYKLPEAGKTGTGLSADFTLNPYLALLQKHRPGFFLSGATLGLESTYDPAGKGLGLTGGKFGLDFFGGALKAEGKTFNELSPYPQWVPGRDPGAPGTGLMNELPGMPATKRSGAQFMLNADLLKLIPGLNKKF